MLAHSKLNYGNQLISQETWRYDDGLNFQGNNPMADKNEFSRPRRYWGRATSKDQSDSFIFEGVVSVNKGCGARSPGGIRTYSFWDNLETILRVVKG